MTLVVLAAVTAVVLAVLFRGRPSTFGRPTVHRFGLLGIVVIGLSTSLLAKSTGVHAGWLVAAALSLVWFAAVNRGRPGLLLAIGGLALNAVVIILNAGMPVSLAAVERAGVPLSRVPLDTDPLREELTTETVLPWLGEAVPLALPIRPAVVSPGDVLVAAGSALFLFTGLTGLGRTVPDRIRTKAERSANRAEKKARRAAKLESPPDDAAPAPGIFVGSASAPWFEGEPDDDLPFTGRPAPHWPDAESAEAPGPDDQVTAEAPTAAWPGPKEWVGTEDQSGAEPGRLLVGPPIIPGRVGPGDSGAAHPPVEDPAAAEALAEAIRVRKRERHARKRERKQAARLAAAAEQPADADPGDGAQRAGSVERAEPADIAEADQVDQTYAARTGPLSNHPSGNRANP